MSEPCFIEPAAERPDALAILCEEEGVEEGTRTWGELERNVRRVANGLAGLGVAAGERVAVLAHNRPEYVEMILGNLRAGTRHVPLNWHLKASDLAYILENSQARVVVCDPAHEATAREAAAKAGVAHVLCMGGSYADWLGAQSTDVPANRQAGGMLMYTSGTTGRQKGVVRSDQTGTIDRVFERYRRVGGIWGYRRAGVHLVVCPLYHAAPPATALFGLAYGQSLVLHARFDAKTALDAIARHRVTTTHLVPTQIIRLLRLPDGVKQDADTSSLEAVFHGAAPCPEWAKRAAIDWLGPIVIEYFGSSEGTGPLIATSEEWLAHPGTVGKPHAALEVSVVDDDGNDLPTGEVGTLYFRRADGAPSYHGDADKTARMRLPDGRFTVGDVGRLDEDGFVHLADRKIDMIISGGVNIYPSEIEAVLSQHDAVEDCAVFGIPDDEWGEQVKAAVTLRPGASADEPALLAHCRDRLAGYQCPKSIDFLDAMPREASGKLKKRLLRDPYWEGTGRRI